MKKLLFLSIALLLSFQFLANNGKDVKPAPKTVYGSCTAFRAGDGTPVTIICSGSEGICKIVDGNSVEAFNCDLQGDWGSILSPANIRFTFSSYLVVSENPNKVEYSGVIMK